MPAEGKDKLDKEYITALADKCYKLSIPSEAKVAFTKFIHATEKEEIQRLRGLIIYSMFNSEDAFGSARIHETDIKSWYGKMCEALDPDLSPFEEGERQKILAVLTKEKAGRDETAETTSLFERLMNFL